MADDVAKPKIFTRPIIVGIVCLVLGLAVLKFLPGQWIAWSFLLFLAIKHLALLLAAGGPVYAAVQSWRDRRKARASAG